MPDNPNELSGSYSWFGIYRAKVINSLDPDKMGRVKVWVPDLMPEVTDDYGLWARPANNSIGGSNTIEKDFDTQRYQGCWMVPPEGSYLYVFFESGNPNAPRYMAGADFGQQRAPIEAQQGSDFDQKWILYKTRMGRIVILSDDAHDERVEITGKKAKLDNGCTQAGCPSSVYEIDGNQSTILIDGRDGEEKILIKDHTGNYININTTDGKIDIETPDGEINIKAARTIKITSAQNIDIKSDADVNIQGANVNIVGDTNVNVKAGTDLNEVSKNHNVKATTMSTDLISSIDMRSGGQANIQGASVNVKGDASAKFGGGVVEINGTGIVGIDGASLSLQNGASSPPNSASPTTATSASDAVSAVPDGNRNNPSTTKGMKDITIDDTKGTTLVPPVDTRRFTEKPPNKTGSDR